MNSNTEKRTFDRHYCSVPIAFSYFNKEHRFEARTNNYSAGGMYFKSSLFLKPGATVYIRIEDFNSDNSCTSICYGLRSVSLAEVKWCDEKSDTDVLSYGVGVKYFEPYY
jgi:hypothetical protein